MTPAIYRKLFGDEGSRIFGWGFSFIGIASFIKIVTLKMFLDSLGFKGFLYMYGGFCVLALLILIFVFQEKKVDIQKLKLKYERS